MTEDVVRLGSATASVKRAEDASGGPTLFGHFAVFDTFAEIDSYFEGRFLERIAPGAFKKTFREQRDEIKVLLNHGHDPSVGDKPLGPINELREDEQGAYYEVPLLDTSYNRDLIPGLEQGLYGASFRFRVVKEKVDEDPGQSAQNPKGLPERTLTELRLFEFGPVTFPAYASATAGVRSLTDERILTGLYRAYPERTSALFKYVRSITTEDEQERAEADRPPHSEQERALPEGAAGTESHSDRGSREPRETRPLVLPSPPQKRGGVLPNHEEGSWRPLRLP